MFRLKDFTVHVLPLNRQFVCKDFTSFQLSSYTSIKVSVSHTGKLGSPLTPVVLLHLPLVSQDSSHPMNSVSVLISYI